MSNIPIRYVYEHILSHRRSFCALHKISASIVRDASDYERPSFKTDLFVKVKPWIYEKLGCYHIFMEALNENASAEHWGIKLAPVKFL